MSDSPILFIDSDEDDQLLFSQALNTLQVHHPILLFTTGQSAIDYLTNTEDSPFLIISEMNLPGMNGLELRQQIEQDVTLRKKSIPFIFMTAPVEDHLIEQAYELTIQGLFEKKPTFEEWKQQLNEIVSYWQECLHPKRINRVK